MAREEIEVEVTKGQLELLKHNVESQKALSLGDDIAHLNDIRIGYKEKYESQTFKGNIGIGHSVRSNGWNSIIIGHNSECKNGNSIQIGTGINKNEGTVQIKDTTILNADGKIPIESLNREIQDKLISGENIKTINGNSLLGSGDITIQGGGSSGDLSDYVKNTDYATATKGGVVKASYNGGVTVLPNGEMAIVGANSSDIKNATASSNPITPRNQYQSVFYGLAKASGDTTQAQSNNPIGTYTDEAKASIQEMLGINDLINNAIGGALGGSY